MANAPEIVAIALKLKPDIVCFVPERRAEVTTEGGLDVASQIGALTETRKRMNDVGIEVSLFIAPEARQVEASAATGAQFVELHTGAFAEEFSHRQKGQSLAVSSALHLHHLAEAAKQAHRLGLRVNAGHGLNYENVPALRAVPNLVELNIGHSIVSRAMAVGIGQAVREMLKTMEEYVG
jgi:pyridoxine 5-phosphate synthase